MYLLARDTTKIQSMVSTECIMHICFCRIVYGTVIKSEPICGQKKSPNYVGFSLLYTNIEEFMIYDILVLYKLEVT